MNDTKPAIDVNALAQELRNICCHTLRPTEIAEALVPFISEQIRAAIQAVPVQAIPETVIKYVPVDSNLRKSNWNHPKDDEPQTEACKKALNDRGDDQGQGLDGYWKWGFRAGFNAALSAAPTPSSQSQVAESDESAADYETIMGMGRMLARIAIAVKGEEQAKKRHGYADLPELVEKMAIELEVYRAAPSTQAEPLHQLAAKLHAYEEIAEHYAKCAISPEALRDWVADRVGKDGQDAQAALTQPTQDADSRDAETQWEVKDGVTDWRDILLSDFEMYQRLCERAPGRYKMRIKGAAIQAKGEQA